MGSPSLSADRARPAPHPQIIMVAKSEGMWIMTWIHGSSIL